MASNEFNQFGGNDADDDAAIARVTRGILGQIDAELTGGVPMEATNDFTLGAYAASMYVAGALESVTHEARAKFAATVTRAPSLDGNRQARMWLQFANNLVDPHSLHETCKSMGHANSTEFMTGADFVLRSTIAVWTLKARHLFLDADVVRLPEFLDNVDSIATVMRNAADASFGAALTFDDAELDGLL